MQIPVHSRFLAAIFLIGVALPCWAQMKFIEGVDYHVLDGTPSNKKQVLEFFSYSCPHCYTVDPLIEEYLSIAPKEYGFDRIPVTFGRGDWKKSAEVYTLAGLLGKREELHGQVFERIHVNRQPFRNDGDVKAFFLDKGVEEAEFDGVAASFSAKSAYKRYETLTRKLKISAVPTVIVRDAYQVELSRIRTSQQLHQLIDFLMQR